MSADLPRTPRLSPADASDELPPSINDLFPLEANTVETDTDICRDITLLSALLEGYRSGYSTVLDSKRAGNSSADLWSHVSYALVPGSVDDPYGNKVVAVVGRIEPGSIAATVISRNTSTYNARPRPVEVDAVGLLDYSAVTAMLNNVAALPDNVEFNVHLRDLMSIVSYLLSLTEPRPEELHMATYLFNVIVLRCYRKLYARLDSGITFWIKHPLEVLWDFYEKRPIAVAQGSSSTASIQESADHPMSSPVVSTGSSPVVSQGSSEPIDDSASSPPQVSSRETANASPPPVTPLSVRLPRAYQYTYLLDEHSIVYAMTEACDVDVVFSPSDAPAWAKLLHTCYTTMYTTLSQDGLNKAGKPARVARRPAAAGELLDLHSALAVLDDVIGTDIIACLFHDDLVEELNRRYTESMIKKTKSRLASAISAAQAGDEPIEYHFDPDDLQANKEDSRRHIIRHLRALTIPLRAARNIVHACYTAPPGINTMNAYQVVVTPDSQTTIDQRYFDRFSEAVASRWGEDGPLVHQVLARTRRAILKLSASVHAEAAVMSLVSSELRETKVDVSGTLTPIANLLPTSPAKSVDIPDPSVPTKMMWLRRLRDQDIALPLLE
ncbi:hypothetical protein OH76DRAFT_1255448 [Lentinus brumalis]|uniref:Uncharacterized protein n=1 Tax=Lentinus brumalis TaxID=2498619 RepID=A0A371CRL1_9APHY|nr:hypothetical protein OH76DRAFT_1255448 [Polyporus brumalis]